MNAIVYDVEIRRCIPPRVGRALSGVEYCGGWEDFEGMGIACIGVYDYADGVASVFLDDNLADFQALVDAREHVIGFNSLSFDDRLCAAHGIRVQTTYDLLREVRLASGQPGEYARGLTRAGYTLDALAQANLGIAKSSSGEDAPRLWQQGKIGAVVSYCLRDVGITRRLFDHRAALKDPVTGEWLLSVIMGPEELRPDRLLGFIPRVKVSEDQVEEIRKQWGGYSLGYGPLVLGQECKEEFVPFDEADIERARESLAPATDCGEEQVVPTTGEPSKG